jgi:hypothetical protein
VELLNSAISVGGGGGEEAGRHGGMMGRCPLGRGGGGD